MADGDAAYGGDAMSAMISVVNICSRYCQKLCTDASDV